MDLLSTANLHPTTRRLILARAVRSIGQGALVVDFALYLHALSWSGLAIGLVLSGSGMAGAGLSLLVGSLSDSLRRKPFILVYEGISLLGSLAALLSDEPWILVSAAVTGQFGRGVMGAAGPFSPAEQAWLAEEVAPEYRGFVYSLNSALGFWGMAVGAICAILPPFFNSWLPGPLAYRPLFGLVALTSCANLLILSKAEEKYLGSRGHGDRREKRFGSVTRQENVLLIKLMLINSLNGTAIGLTGPLISYWFARRFLVGPMAIAPMLSATFALTGLLSLATGWMTARKGIIRSIVWERLVGVALLLFLPFMPTYWLASVLYILRTVFYRAPAGAQQAIIVGLVRDERRGLAVSLNAVSFQLPRSVGPGIAGYFLDAGFFSLPFVIAASLQVVYLAMYKRTFREYEPYRQAPEEDRIPM